MAEPCLVLPVADVAAKLLRWAGPQLSMVIDPCVVHDAKKPCAQTRFFTERVKLTVGLEHRVLNEILGVSAIAGQPSSGVIEVVEERDRIAFESRRQLRVSVPTFGAHNYMIR
jgi:hypothetical protein